MNMKLVKKNFFVKMKLWNRGFGTETPIPQLHFRNNLERNEDSGYGMNIKYVNDKVYF